MLTTITPPLGVLEVFAVPYLGISAVIGWVIFEPFFRDGVVGSSADPPPPAGVAITDLMAVVVPLGVSFAWAGWAMPEAIRSPTVQAIVIGLMTLFAAAAWVLGLFLLPPASRGVFLKRMAVVGIISPLGIVMTVGWIGFILWAGGYSILALVPSTVGVAACSAGLRVLSVWVCRPAVGANRE